MSEERLGVDIARSYLRTVDPPWKSFWFHMHLVAHDLTEFASGLAEISDEVYEVHNSGQKNDLADWVQEVIGDTALSRQLLGARSRQEAATVAKARVEELRSILKG